MPGAVVFCFNPLSLSLSCPVKSSLSLRERVCNSKSPIARMPSYSINARANDVSPAKKRSRCRSRSKSERNPFLSPLGPKTLSYLYPKDSREKKYKSFWGGGKGNGYKNVIERRIGTERDGERGKCMVYTSRDELFCFRGLFQYIHLWR